MRIALFGGSFDPPHRGHLGVAEAARARFSLDRVLLAPAGRQPLKPGGACAPFADRLAMCALLVDGRPALEASDADAPRPDGQPNYTADTLRVLRDTLPAHAELLVLTGADAFRTLPHWREPDALLQMAEWIVVSRPGVPLQETIPTSFTEAQRQRVYPLDGVAFPVSATELRRRLAMGEDTSAGLTMPVEEYIRQHGLYRPETGDVGMGSRTRFEG